MRANLIMTGSAPRFFVTGVLKSLMFFILFWRFGLAWLFAAIITLQGVCMKKALLIFCICIAIGVLCYFGFNTGV